MSRSGKAASFGLALLTAIMAGIWALGSRERVSQTVTQWPDGTMQTSTATTTEKWMNHWSGR